MTVNAHAGAGPMSPTTSNHLDKLYPELREDGEHIAVTQTYTVSSDRSSRNDSAV
jgi:hypothetical protein